MKLTYAITVCDEVNELKTLVSKLQEFDIHTQHEILVLKDLSKICPELDEYLQEYDGKKFKVIYDYLNNDFSLFKNNILNYATGEYIFQIDADEIPSDTLLQYLEYILEENCDIDMFLIPRRNIVEGITEEWIKKWGWNVNSDGYINSPDKQFRIFKNNGKIRWKNKVHEVLYGYNRYSSLTNDYFLWHIKSLDKQIKQNKLYSESKFY